MWITIDKSGIYKLWVKQPPIKDEKLGVWKSKYEFPKIVNDEQLKNGNYSFYHYINWINTWPYLIEENI